MNGQGRLARLLAPQILRPAAAIAMFAVFGLALWVIHYETRTMSFEDIRAAIGNVGMIDVAAGCGLTALSSPLFSPAETAILVTFTSLVPFHGPFPRALRRSHHSPGTTGPLDTLLLPEVPYPP